MPSKARFVKWHSQIRDKHHDQKHLEKHILGGVSHEQQLAQIELNEVRLDHGADSETYQQAAAAFEEKKLHSKREPKKLK